MRAIPILLAVPTAALAACSGGGPATGPAPESRGDLRAGAAAFVESCASCHASRDGFDLAYFSFPDSAIRRRAAAHVDPATADDIAAWVTSLAVASVPRATRPFQPGGAVLADDVEFAARLLGGDAWPLDWTTADLLAVDPLEVPIAVPLPRWSEEGTDLDWMPDDPLGEGVLDHRGGRPREALDAYYSSPSWEGLGLALAALRAADRDPLDPFAPCRAGPPSLFRAEPCFETRRWVASLAAQHVLREGAGGFVHRLVHDAWWDVGDAARRSIIARTPIERAEENWAGWMMLGWIFDPGRHASVYTGNALVRRGLPRHATFVALRSQVARPEGSVAPYLDARNAARFAPEGWAHGVVRLAFLHLLERLEAGETPRGEAAGEAAGAVEEAFVRAARSSTAAGAAELAALRSGILARLE